jgi:Flp pilus assembly protein TadG
VAIVVAIFLPILITIAALAIDISNLMLVKNELQNAADAAAQAGAQCLYPRPDCYKPRKLESELINLPRPHWINAESIATQAVPNNAVQGTALADSVVTSGYWNVTGTPNTLQLLPHTPGTNDAPAVQVTIAKESGKNAGSVTLYLAGLMGLRNTDLSATAISVATSPGLVNPGGLFPFTMAQCMYDAYWDSTKGMPRIFQLGDKDPNNLTQTVGKPWLFHLGWYDKKTLFKTPDGVLCDAGQWTPLATKGGADDIKGLVTKSQLSPKLALNDVVLIRSGNINSGYKETLACSAIRDKTCEFVTVLVTGRAVPGALETINAFGCLHILTADNGSKPYIEVRMSNNCPNPEGGGVGPYYGVANPPRLGL